MVLTLCLFALSVCSVWVNNVQFSHYVIPVWPLALCFSIASSIMEGYLEFNAVMWIACFILLAFITQKNRSNVILHTLTLIAVGCMAFLFAIGQFHGFNNPVIVAGMQLSPVGQPFTHTLHIERIIVGIILLATFCNPVQSWVEWRLLLTTTVPIALVTVVTVLGIGILVGYVSIDVKFIPYTVLFFITNLLFTCVYEEAFFRGFLQENLSKILARWQIGKLFAVGITALLFGLVHYKGGQVYVMLATLAGIFYGYAKYHVKRIEAAILTHFSVNAVHFVALTYPNF